MRNRSYNKVKLSVVIITLNEERNIERCLRSVQPVADEIVVLDSGSSDNTRFICELILSGTRFYSLLNERIRKMNCWSLMLHLLKFTEEP